MKVIIYADDSNDLIIGARSAKTFLNGPSESDLYGYEYSDGTVKYFSSVKRNSNSITVHVVKET